MFLPVYNSSNLRQFILFGMYSVQTPSINSHGRHYTQVLINEQLIKNQKINLNQRRRI